MEIKFCFIFYNINIIFLRHCFHCHWLLLWLTIELINSQIKLQEDFLNIISFQPYSVEFVTNDLTSNPVTDETKHAAFMQIQGVPKRSVPPIPEVEINRFTLTYLSTKVDNYGDTGRPISIILYRPSGDTLYNLTYI